MQVFNLDLSVKRVIPLLYAKQRDVGAKIQVKLTDNNVEYVVPDGVTWSVWYSGASGEGNYTEIDGREAVTVDGSTATVELIYQMLDNPGPGEMCLVMNNANGTQLGLWNIPYWVEAIPGADSKAATAYYQAFLQAREGAEAAAGRAEAAAKRAESVDVNNAVLFTPQNPTPEQQAQARENIGIYDNPDIHAEYFSITDDGVLSLKPEYRGATTYAELTASISDRGAGVNGSKNNSLPKILYIPETVNGIVVTNIADGAFIDNQAFVEVVLPSTIDSLPNRCFYRCCFLEEVYNTENITSLGVRCFNYCSSMKIAKFPNLTEALAESSGAWTFGGNPNLVFADIGNMKTIPARMFIYDQSLQRVRNRGSVTNVGDATFYKAARLKDVGDLSQLTTIGGMAFIAPNIKGVDWSTYTGTGVANYSTPAKINPTDFWSACTFTPCENPLPTFLSQRNPEWTNETIGESSVIYNNGCQLFAVLHAYCGLHNIKLNSPLEFEEIVNRIQPGALDSYTQKPASMRSLATAVDLQYEQCGQFNQATLQAVYDALADGKYVAVQIGNGGPQPIGHIVLAYGITSDGQLMFVDSDSCYIHDPTIPNVYSAFYKNFLYCNPGTTAHIFSL